MSTSIKTKLKRLICDHIWQIRTISKDLEEITCKCTKCSLYRKGKINWSKPYDPLSWLDTIKF